MDNSKIIIGFFTFLLIYAFIFEYRDGNHSFFLGKPNDKDNINTILMKIDICTRYELNMVKWRRFFICAYFITLIIFFIVYHRVPSAKEFLLYIVIIFSVLLLNHKNYNCIITKEAVNYNSNNIINLKNKL